MIIYFDCFSGISGDMALGALFNLGLDIQALRTELHKLNIDGWEIAAEPGMRSYISGTRALVHAPEQASHRHLADVRAIIEGSTLSEHVKSRSIHIFSMLASAEGQIHGISAEQVHFHEIGALDAIIDIVGVVCGLALLGVEQVYASALPLGSGWVRAAHGSIPVPAPATLALLANAKAAVLSDVSAGELVTPTGAALLAGLALFQRPAMQLLRVGYGLGKRDPADRPNVLCAWLGRRLDQAAEPRGQDSGALAMGGVPDQQGEAEALEDVVAGEQATSRQPELVLLETNIDDQPGEQLAYICEQLLAAGALDAWITPILMKKGRPAILLSALIPASHEPTMVELILRESSTLGIRRRSIERYVAERCIERVQTVWGSVRVKRKYWHGHDLGAMPEYEDCAAIARTHGLALRDVYRLVLSQTSSSSA